eukprot:351868-Chlamydomonas_euryale.AAC.1
MRHLPPPWHLPPAHTHQQHAPRGARRRLCLLRQLGRKAAPVAAAAEQAVQQDHRVRCWRLLGANLMRRGVGGWQAGTGGQ